jgi:hypothetical protein
MCGGEVIDVVADLPGELSSPSGPSEPMYESMTLKEAFGVVELLKLRLAGGTCVMAPPP